MIIRNHGVQSRGRRRREAEIVEMTEMAAHAGELQLYTGTYSTYRVMHVP
jgi:hypothetical protein